MITSPTRFAGRTATLIDNIFTNAPTQVTSAIILSADISDHLPVLIHLDLTPLTKTGPTTYFSRNINDSSMEHFKILLTEIDWSSVLDICKQNDPSAAYDTFVGLFKVAYDKAFPLLQCTRHKRNFFKQPWMTTGLLKSCRTKSKLYLKMLKHPTATNKENYVKYRNKFKLLRIKTERIYYASEFKNIRATLSILGKLLDLFLTPPVTARK